MAPSVELSDGVSRCPTFFVGTERQKQKLEGFSRREQHFEEALKDSKPLCFNSQSYQKTHPAKASKGHKDADATLVSPFILGVADGVSQVEDFGIDASLLPNELLKVCEELGMCQLLPDNKLAPQDSYCGPIPLIRRAFEATESLGSLTVILAIMDNSTQIHGKQHPMLSIITIGDCELLILRRGQEGSSPLQLVCHTEMQRINGHAQTPLQLARVDARIDPHFNEGITIEVIEKGSVVHCVSAHEGDIVVMGSDGVFDNLFLHEIVELCNLVLPPGQPSPLHKAQLSHLATLIVKACHDKTEFGPGGLPEAPIGQGGKKDDTSVVVAEVVEWTEAHRKTFMPAQQTHQWQTLLDRLNSNARDKSAQGQLFEMSFDKCCSGNGVYDSDEEFESRSTHVEPEPSATSSSDDDWAALMSESDWPSKITGCTNVPLPPTSHWGNALTKPNLRRDLAQLPPNPGARSWSPRTPEVQQLHRSDPVHTGFGPRPPKHSGIAPFGLTPPMAPPWVPVLLQAQRY